MQQGRGLGALENTSDYCSLDSQYNFGSGIDNTDNATFTVAAQNQIKQGQNGLSVAGMFRSPVAHDAGSLPFDRFGNRAVSALSVVPTLAMGAAEEPSVSNSLYLVQGSRLWRTDDDLGTSVALDDTSWAGATSLTAIGSDLYDWGVHAALPPPLGLLGTNGDGCSSLISPRRRAPGCEAK